MFERHPVLRKIIVLLKYAVMSLAIFLVSFILLYFAWLREWQMNWGATDEEVIRYMAGDELIEDPSFNATRAVEINATPEEIWPWIVQMGYKRAGFYSYDNLDNAGIPSAERIIPELQNVKVGDTLVFLEVVVMEPNRSMLWVFTGGPWRGATWSWGLYEADDGRTRLISRLRQKFTVDSFGAVIGRALIDIFEILPMRKCLLGIKSRAEKLVVESA
jgi:hypothetical protein